MDKITREDLVNYITERLDNTINADIVPNIEVSYNKDIYIYNDNESIVINIMDIRYNHVPEYSFEVIVLNDDEEVIIRNTLNTKTICKVFNGAEWLYEEIDLSPTFAKFIGEWLLDKLPHYYNFKTEYLEEE